MEAVTKAVLDVEELISSESKDVPPFIPKKVNYDLDISKFEMEWVDRCAIGRIREGFQLMELVKKVVTEGFKVSVCPMGGVTTLLTFDTKMGMVEQLKDDKMKTWFDGLRLWDSSTMKREMTVWVMLEEVPLQGWHAIFFASLGNS